MEFNQFLTTRLKSVCSKVLKKDIYRKHTPCVCLTARVIYIFCTTFLKEHFIIENFFVSFIFVHCGPTKNAIITKITPTPEPPPTFTRKKWIPLAKKPLARESTFVDHKIHLDG